MWKLKLNFLLCAIALIILTQEGLLWSWSYGSWIYNYLCNQCLSPLTLRVWTLFWWGVLNTTLCDKVCRWLATGQWFSQGTLVSFTNKTDLHDITEILLKWALKHNNTNPLHRISFIRKKLKYWDIYMHINN